MRARSARSTNKREKNHGPRDNELIIFLKIVIIYHKLLLKTDLFQVILLQLNYIVHILSENKLLLTI